MDREFLEWAKELPHFEKELMRRYVRAYLTLGLSEDEACHLAELDYLDYIKSPKMFLLNLGVKKEELEVAADIHEYCKALGF